MKDQGPAPYYAFLFPVLSEIARKHGYALALHGSMGRDVDLLAAPWVEDAADIDVLVKAYHEYANIWSGYKPGTYKISTTEKPHGRRSFSIPLGCGAYMDLSVMPKVEPPQEA